MDESRSRSLEERVEALELRVEELQRNLRTSQGVRPPDHLRGPEQAQEADASVKAPDAEGTGGASSPAPKASRVFVQTGRPDRRGEGLEGQSTTQPTGKFAEPSGSISESESWLGKIGIGLVLFGVIFLFKYSIDEGWITPPVRALTGLALGIGMLMTGVRIRADRRPLGQLLSGGGIGALYITGFAAYRLYDLVSHPAAFAFMVFITVLAFLLSQRQEEAALSLIGTAGGLGTPFLLYQGSGNLPGLVGYTCLVLGGAVAIYYRRGWRSLFWASFAGCWLIFNTLADPQISMGGPLALQLGILFGWFAFSAMPVLREVRTGRVSVDEFPHAHLASVLTPLLVLWLSGRTWLLSRVEWGWMALAGAAVYGVAALILKGRDEKTRIATTHALLGLLLGTVAICLLLEGDALFFAVAVEAAALHLISHKLADRGTAACAHVLFSAVAVWLAAHLMIRFEEGSMLNAQAMTDLAVLLIGAGVSRAILSRDAAALYRILAHAAFLAWLWGALMPLPNGAGYVSITWGLYAVALLILGLRLNLRGLRIVAMGTLFLVVGKLFLMDLAALRAIWRILLFLGFGGLFLVLSYLISQKRIFGRS